MPSINGEIDLERRFGGIARLYGAEALACFQAAHIAVVGVGGVGSWAVEALARSGIGQLTLLDLDNVAESNVNRQLPALDPYFGCAKVSVLAKRVRAINPYCLVNEIEDFISAENISELLTRPFAFLIDAIDDLRAKTALSAWCVKQKQAFIVSGGAGGRMNPALIRSADLGQLNGDPLLAKLRYNLRHQYGFSRTTGEKLNVACVYSDEQIIKPQASCSTNAPQGLSCAGYGSSMAVTATFAMHAVAATLKHLQHKAQTCGKNKA